VRSSSPFGRKRSSPQVHSDWIVPSFLRMIACASPGSDPEQRLEEASAAADRGSLELC
jgi:hypothetical protein